jgi:neutral ceramidase
MNSLKAEGASPQIIRTAECDWFGTERRELLARLREEGLLEEEIARRQPAEIQLFAIGPWRFLAWPGEIFVEFGLEVMEKRPDTYVLAYANGETYGYLVTEEAAEEAGYEASTALFKSPESPRLLTAASIELLLSLKRSEYADDERLIGEYSILMKNGEWILRTEARDPRVKKQ